MLAAMCCDASRGVVLPAVLAALAATLSGCALSSTSKAPEYCSHLENQTEFQRAAAASYSEELAALHAELSTAAYCGSGMFGDDRALLEWNCGAPCSKFKMQEVRIVQSDANDGAYAFVARVDDSFQWGGAKCIVSFRGTVDKDGWLENLKGGAATDLNGWGMECKYNGVPCRVGLGFIRGYSRIREQVMGTAKEICGEGAQVSVTGHSLGAAEAVLGMLDLKRAGFDVIPSYTFGAPRVGDQAFNSVFRQHFPSQMHYFRVTHYMDPVPQLPPTWYGFEHLNAEIYYSSWEYKSHTRRACEGGEDPCCSAQWGDQVNNVIKQVTKCGLDMGFTAGCDHSTYLLNILDHQLSSYACSHPDQALHTSGNTSIAAEPLNGSDVEVEGSSSMSTALFV